jgi:predicted MFS family arabinose efflux permease
MGNLRPKSRGSLVGYAASSYNFGGFAASVGLGFVITLSGWRIGLATLAGLGLVYIPVMFFLMGPAASLQGPRQDLRPSGSSDSRLLKSRNALFASSSLLMAAYASFTITSWTPAYLIHIGVKSSLTGVVIGAYALAGGVAAIVSGRLADAWGEKRLMMCTGTGAAAVSIPLYLLGLNFSSALVLMAAVGFLLWPYWNLAISMVQRLVDPVMVGSMTGLVLNIGMVGGFLGPTLTGILIDYFGFGPAMAGSVVVSLCLYVLLIAPFREATRENREYVVQA